MSKYGIHSAKVSVVVAALIALSGSTALALSRPDAVILSKSTDFKNAGPKDKSPRLDFGFASDANPTEITLQVDHGNMMQAWIVEVNGQVVGELGRSYKTTGKSYVPVPASTLKSGSNTVSIVGEMGASRSSAINRIALFKKPLRELFKLRHLSVSVTDDETGKPIPARMSIVDGQGEGAEIFYTTTTNNAVRTGLIYTTGAPTAFEIAEGRYQIYATRGMEWSLARKTISLDASGKPAQIDLRIRRQVDTKGFIAADTHIHNVTFSGHGDASIDERMVTLAGEGVELAVATDHNHFTDYRPYQKKWELNQYFTPVVGDEMTTKNGHLNAFPMPLGGKVPNGNESDWVKLVADARVKGAKIVILNHPRFPDRKTNPMEQFGFNRASGDRFTGPAFTFDGIELANSSSGSCMSLEDVALDQTRLMADWFPILNRGEKIVGVGSSDSHTVSNPVGQGRTYIRSSVEDPAKLNVDELVGNFLAGDTSVSYGIFAEASVNGQHMGQTVQPKDGKVEVNLRVASAEWIKPRRAMVFLNGLPVAEKPLEPTPGKPFNQRIKFSIKPPAHDAYLVCAVFGDGISEPYWPTLAKFTTAVVNPIYLDNDGDGKFEFPRTTARKLLSATDGSLKIVWALIEKSDDALAGQMLGVLYLEKDKTFVKQLDARVKAAAPNRAVYRTFLDHSPLIVIDAKKLKAPAASSSKE